MSQALHHLSNKRFCNSSSSPSSKKARLGGGKSIESLRTLSARVGSSLLSADDPSPSAVVDATLPSLPDLLPELPPLPISPNVVSTSDVSLDDDVFLQSLVEDPLLNQTRDGGLPVVDLDIYDLCFADCDDGTSATRQVCSIDNSLQTRVAVYNTLALFLGHSHGLLVCNCHLFCQPGKNICRKCLDSSSGERNSEDSESEEARAVSEDASAISEGASTISPEIVQKMVNSDVYRGLLKMPCSSPKKKGKGNSFVGFDAVKEAWPKLTFNFNNLTQSRSAGRDLQLPSIPVVVYIMMKAMKYKTKDDAPLRVLICSMILSDKEPRQSRFFFSDKVMKKRLKSIGYDDRDDDFIMNVSLVLRASMFVLDLFAYAEAFDMVDVVANFFLTDKECIGSEDAELVHQFASLGYSIEFLTKTLARAFEDCSVSKKGLLIRCTVSDTSVKKCMAGPIMKSFLECLPLVGLYPELGNGSELPHVQEFSACLRSALSLSLIEDKQKRKEVVSYYLDSMLGDRASTSDMIDAMLSNGRVRVLPLFLVAFSCHLSKTALKSSCSAFDVALLGGKARKVQSSGGVRLVERTNGLLIEDPSFEHFRLKQSMEYETDLSKVLLHCFKMSDMASLFRPSQRERKINFDIRPFSLNFNEAEDVTREVEAMMMKVASNPDLYTSNRRFTETLMKLSEFAAQVISSSGVDAVTTAEDTACMVANSQLSNIQYPIL